MNYKLFTDDDFGEADNFFAEFITLLGTIDHFAFLLLPGSKGRDGLVFVGVEISVLRLDGVYVVLVEEREELLIDELQPLFQSLILLNFLPFREGLRVGLYCPFEIIDEGQHLREDALAGGLHEFEFLLVGTAAEVIKLRHHPQVLVLELGNALLRFRQLLFRRVTFLTIQRCVTILAIQRSVTILTIQQLCCFIFYLFFFFDIFVFLLSTFVR